MSFFRFWTSYSCLSSIVELLVLVYADMRGVIRLKIVCNWHVWQTALGNPDIFDKYVVLISASLIAAQMMLLLVHILSAIQKVVAAAVLNDLVCRWIIGIKKVRRTASRPTFKITIWSNSTFEHGVGDFLRWVLHQVSVLLVVLSVRLMMGAIRRDGRLHLIVWVRLHVVVLSERRVVLLGL